MRIRRIIEYKFPSSSYWYRKKCSVARNILVEKINVMPLILIITISVFDLNSSFRKKYLTRILFYRRQSAMLKGCKLPSKLGPRNLFR